MTLNRIHVIGNVGNDPEMRYTPNGNPVTSFRMATNRRYTTSEGEQREETEWFTISTWNRLAERANQYVTKGMKVYVEGRLKSSPYMSNAGEPRAGNEINAFELVFLDRAPGAGAGADQEGGAAPEGGTGPETDAENLPW